MKAYKDGAADFSDLDFAEQAKSISAKILALEAAIEHHVEAISKAKTPKTKKEVATTCRDQVDRLLARLNDLVAKYP